MEDYVGKPELDPNFVPDSKRLFNGYQVNKVDPTQIKVWLTKGWADIKASPFASIAYGLIFSALGIIIHLVVSKNPAFSIAMTTGFLLIAPFLALGLYDLSRQLEQKQQADLAESFGSIKYNIIGFSLYALALGILMLFWIQISAVIIGLFFDSTAVATGGYKAIFASLLRLEGNSLAFIAVFFGLGLLFALMSFITGVVTAPLLLDRKVDIVTAASTSFYAFMKNPVTLLLWALTIVVLVGIGFLTFNLGLIVLMPLVAHASWHAYRALVK